MRPRDLLAAALLPAALAAAAAAQPAAPALLTIGAAAAVHGRVDALAPGAAAGRVIESGKPLFQNDRVTTDAEGKLQILLADETVFTIGSGADMVLDKFVYDPSHETGRVSATISKGSFRFVSGRIARRHPEDVKVKLDVGTIGIRGTVVAGRTGPGGSTIINAGAGPDNDAEERPSAITVTNDGVTVLINTPGEGVTVAPGQPPSAPVDMSAQLDEISVSLEQKPSQQAAAPAALPEPVSQASGQATAAGQILASDGSQQADQSQSSNDTVTQAEQTGVALTDGAAQWSDLFTLQGQWMYKGSGTYTGGNGGGTFTFQMNVNFDARTLGGTSTGGPSSVTLSGALTDTTDINVRSFGTSGPAVTTFSGGDLTNSVFDGTSATFINQSGQAGASMRLDVKDSNGSTTGSGTGTKQNVPLG